MKKKPPVRRSKVKNSVASCESPLQQALFGTTGFPGGFGSQLSQADTLFVNNRWYLISNMRQLLSEMYVENGLVQTIVDIPVDDGLRGGVEIKTKQLDDSQIQQLNVVVEREQDLAKLGQSAKWNRLFGGGGIVLITDQDPEEPLNVEALTDGNLELRDVDMWELYWSMQATSDYSLSIDQSDFDVEYYDYYGVKLHRSRVLRMKGLRAPSFIRPRLRGWGFSILESIVRSINQYLKANNLTFEVLDEFKIDVFKIKDLAASLLNPMGAETIRRRISLANKEKNYLSAITMDAEDSYEQKELSFSGLAETMVQIRMQVASDLRIPLTKLFGISAAGFNSGEDDIENYNAMVESQVRQKLKFDIIRVLELRCQQHFGFIPDDLSIEYKPMRIMSATDEENVRNAKFTRLLQAKQAGEITTLEFKNACNKHNLLGIQLDTSIDTIDVEGVGKEDESSKSSLAELPKQKTKPEAP